MMSSSEENFLINNKLCDKIFFEQLVRKYTSHLYKTCLGMGFSEAEAEDITQATWITFFEVAEKFEGRSSIRTFLFGILYNKASEFRKKTKRYEPTESIEEIIDSHFDQNGHWILSYAPISPVKFLELVQTSTIISKCIELLPINQKMAFILKEIDEEITEEICNILTITSTHLGVLLYRARNQLRECIERKSK